MQNNKEPNLLQDIFDLIWYKLFPDNKPKCTKEEIEELFPTLPKEIKYKLPKRDPREGIYIPIGETYHKEKVILNLKENPHSYIVGTTGSGKSCMTKTILTSLITTYKPTELEIYLADLKRVEMNLFRRVKHCKKFVYTVQDTTELIADLLEETNRRYELFMENEVTSIFEYNKLPKVKRLPYQVLYVEEIVMLLEDKRKTAMKLLKQLIAISRASGCYVFLTTQRPSNDVIDNVVKANINNRVVLKCEDSKNSIVALDQAGAELLEGKGEGLLKRGCNIEKFRGYFVEDEEVKKYISKYIKPKKVNKTNKDEIQGEANKTSENRSYKATDTNIDLSWLDNL